MRFGDLHTLRGRRGVPVRRASILAIALLACDQIEQRPAADTAAPASAAPVAQPAVREAMAAMITSAQAMTATCVASELHWELDPQDNYYPKYIHPCIPERCAPKPADLEALSASVKKARGLLDGDPLLDVPSLRGLVALGDALAAFAAAAMGGKPRDGRREAERLSGLSMHHAALVSAFREVYRDAAAPVDPPSLTASLAVDDPGGDPCKGWRIPRFCDVSKVRVSSPLTWRTKPPCIDVTTDPRTPSRF